MLRLIALAVLSMAMFVAAAAAAEATVFRGKTTQGRPASVVIGSDGLLRAARVNWRARCRFGRTRDKTIFSRPHDESTPDAFSDAGTYRRATTLAIASASPSPCAGPGSPTRGASAGGAPSRPRSS